MTALPPRQAFQHRRPPPRRRPATASKAFRPVPQELPVIGRRRAGLVRTALAIEPRDGKMHVFLPPLFAVEDWLELLAAVEETAAETGPPRRAGGLPAASGRTADHFSVTPDPGVIEVNVHPVKPGPSR